MKKEVRSSVLLATAVVAVATLGSCGGNGVNPTEAIASPQTSSFDSSIGGAWMNLAYDLVKAQSISPPVASRIYGYLGVTLYESVVGGIKHGRSLQGQVNGLADGSIPPADPDLVYDWPSVANAALAAVAAGIIPSPSPATTAAITDTENDWIKNRGFVIDPAVLTRSRSYGQQVGAAILLWAGTDGFSTYNACAYTPPTGPGLWEPTPPAFAPNPLQPCWGQLRPFIATSGVECLPPAQMPFDTNMTSAYYAEALEVYTTVNGLTAEQTLIANYWADNAGATGTPPGHWVRITSGFLQNYNVDLAVGAQAYARVGMAVADAFIACWAAKYTYNRERPVTFIRQNIDANWLPLLTTPAFPEYTSGHSTQSGAATTVLAAMFGDVPFTDESKQDEGFQPRSFTSFTAAGDEAALSRLYGGIHYRSGNEVGLTQGRCLGAAHVQRVAFHD